MGPRGAHKHRRRTASSIRMGPMELSFAWSLTSHCNCLYGRSTSCWGHAPFSSASVQVQQFDRHQIYTAEASNIILSSRMAVYSEGLTLVYSASKTTGKGSGKVASMPWQVRNPGSPFIPACHMRTSHVYRMIGLLLSGTKGIFPKEECATAGQGTYAARPAFHLARTAEVSTNNLTT
jgi:hypothetical protein